MDNLKSLETQYRSEGSEDQKRKIKEKIVKFIYSNVLRDKPTLTLDITKISTEVNSILLQEESMNNIDIDEDEGTSPILKLFEDVSENPSNYLTDEGFFNNNLQPEDPQQIIIDAFTNTGSKIETDLQKIGYQSILDDFEMIQRIKEKQSETDNKSEELELTKIPNNNPLELGNFLGRRVISEFITTLSLVGNSSSLNNFRLSDFPYQICYMYNLRSLTFTGHDVLSIPDSIENLRSLEVLDLKNNKLISFPSGVAFLSKLYYLDLFDNFINEIPGDVYQILSARAPKYYEGATYTSSNGNLIINGETDLENKINDNTEDNKKITVSLDVPTGEEAEQITISQTFLKIIMNEGVTMPEEGDEIHEKIQYQLLHKYRDLRTSIGGDNKPLINYLENNNTFRSIELFEVLEDNQLKIFYEEIKKDNIIRKDYILLKTLIEESQVEDDYPFIADLNEVEELESDDSEQLKPEQKKNYDLIIKIYVIVAEKLKMIQTLLNSLTNTPDTSIFNIIQNDKYDEFIEKKIFGIDDVYSREVTINTFMNIIDISKDITLKNLFYFWVQVFNNNLKLYSIDSPEYNPNIFASLKSFTEEKNKLTEQEIRTLITSLNTIIATLRESKIQEIFGSLNQEKYKKIIGEDKPTNVEVIKLDYVVKEEVSRILRDYNFLTIKKKIEEINELEEDDKKQKLFKLLFGQESLPMSITFLLRSENLSKYEDFNNLTLKGEILKLNVHYDTEGELCDESSAKTTKKLGDVIRFYKKINGKPFGLEGENLRTYQNNEKTKFKGIWTPIELNDEHNKNLDLLKSLQKRRGVRMKEEDLETLYNIFKNLDLCLKYLNLKKIQETLETSPDSPKNMQKKINFFLANNTLGTIYPNEDINLIKKCLFIDGLHTFIVLRYLYSLIRYDVNLKIGLNLITIGKYKFLVKKSSLAYGGGGIKFLKGGTQRPPLAFGGEVHRFNPLMNFDEIASEAQIVGDGIREKAKKIKKLVSESFEGRLSEETVQGNPEIKASSTKTVYGKPQDAIRRKNAIRGKGKGRKTQDIQKKISIQSIIEEINKIDTKITYNYNKGNKTLSIIYEGNDYGTVAIKEIFFKDNLYLFRIESIDEDRMMCVPVLIKKLLQKKKPKFTELPSNTYIEIVYHRIEDPTFGLSYPRFLKDEKYGTKTEEEAKDGIGRIEGIIMGVYKILNTNQDTTPYQEKKENVDITDESAYSGYGRVKKPVADASPAVVGDEIYCTYFSEGEVLSKRTMKPKSAQASPSAPQGQNAQESSFIEGIYSGYSSLADNLYSKMSHTKNEEDVYSVYCAYKFEEIPRLLALIERKKDNQAIKDQIPGALNNINNLINELVTPFVPKPPPVMPPDTQGKSIEFLKAKMHTYMGLFIDHPVVGRKIEEQLKTLSTELTEIGQFENVRSVRRSFYEYSVAVSPCSSLEIDIDETYDKTYDQITENSVIEALSSPYYTTDEDGDAAAAANKPYYQTDADLMTNTAPIYSIIEPTEGEAGNLGVYCTIDAEIVTIPAKK